eukprot:10007728-Lingulodinium_polyedra.AAC.1
MRQFCNLPLGVTLLNRVDGAIARAKKIDAYKRVLERVLQEVRSPQFTTAVRACKQEPILNRSVKISKEMNAIRGSFADAEYQHFEEAHADMIKEITTALEGAATAIRTG